MTDNTRTKKASKKMVESLSNALKLQRSKTKPESKRNSSDPMRIAILCPYSMSVPGGVQNQVLLMSQQLRNLGMDARIIAPCDGVPPTNYVISVGSTKSLKSNGSFAPIVDDPQSSSRTLDAIYSFDPDIIHLHEPLVPGPTTAAMIGAQTPMVGTFHAAGQGVQALKYFRHPARGAVSRIHQRVAVSREAQHLAEQYLPGDYKIIPNAIDVEKIQSYSPWPTTKPTVFFIGRHEERKGLKYLIQAWMDSKYCQENAQLVVAGTGPETQELTSMSKDIPSISFLGRISNDELFRRMKAAQVLVAPALYGESFGIILLEAMAAGACVVSTNIPGYRDVARDGVEAYLTEPGNSQDLADAIEKVLQDDVLRNKLISAGHKRCLEFSVEKIVDLYIDLYKEIINVNLSQVS